MTHPLRAAAALVAGLLVQLCVLDLVRVGGASPDLVLAAAAAVGIVGGAERGAVGGFLAGLALDLASSIPFGLAALTGSITGYAVGAAERSVVRARWWLPVAVVAAAGAAGTALFAVLGELLGRAAPDPLEVLGTAAVVGLLNGLLAPVLLPVARWVLDVPQRRPALR